MSAQEKDGGMIRNVLDYKCRWEPSYECVGMIRCSENGSSPPSPIGTQLCCVHENSPSDLTMVVDKWPLTD